MSELTTRLSLLSPEQRQRLLDEWKKRRLTEIAIPIPRQAAESGDFPLSFSQERIWFLDQLSPGSAFYNIASAQKIPFAVNRPVLERALTALVRRHGALRTVFPVVEGEPVQRVLPPQPVACALADLGPVPG